MIIGLSGWSQRLELVFTVQKLNKIACFAEIFDFLDFLLEAHERSSCGASTISASTVGISSLPSLTFVLTNSNTSTGELLQLTDLSDDVFLKRVVRRHIEVARGAVWYYQKQESGLKHPHNYFTPLSPPIRPKRGLIKMPNNSYTIHLHTTSLTSLVQTNNIS